MKLAAVVVLVLGLTGCASLSFLEFVGAVGVADVTLFQGQIGVELSKTLGVTPEKKPQ